MPVGCVVWCVVCGVWCVVCDVWCVVCGVWYVNAYVVKGLLVWCVVCAKKVVVWCGEVKHDMMKTPNTKVPDIQVPKTPNSHVTPTSHVTLK